jgi:hypothetical protein
MPSESQARRNLEALIADYERLLPDERRQMSEASVVRQFVDPTTNLIIFSAHFHWFSRIPKQEMHGVGRC